MSNNETALFESHSKSAAVTPPTPSANPQNCVLTTNVVATTTWTGDDTFTMNVQFSMENQYIGSGSVSLNNPGSTLAEMDFGEVTIEAGSTLSLQTVPSGPANVLYSCTIDDSGSSTTITGRKIASFVTSS